MAGSNNYLGLTTHPRVREAAKQALVLLGTRIVPPLLRVAKDGVLGVDRSALTVALALSLWTQLHCSRMLAISQWNSLMPASLAAFSPPQAMKSS